MECTSRPPVVRRRRTLSGTNLSLSTPLSRYPAMGLKVWRTGIGEKFFVSRVRQMGILKFFTRDATSHIERQSDEYIYMFNVDTVSIDHKVSQDYRNV